MKSNYSMLFNSSLPKVFVRIMDMLIESMMKINYSLINIDLIKILYSRDVKSVETLS